MNKCPCCSRGFGNILHYPFIYINDVRDAEQDFFVSSGEIYVGPGKADNPIAPKEVLDFFSRNNCDAYVMPDGSKWIKWPGEKIYSKQHELIDIKQAVDSKLRPYMERLRKNCLHEIVSREQWMPTFPRHDLTSFLLPESCVTLKFVDMRDSESRTAYLYVTSESADTCLFKVAQIDYTPVDVDYILTVREDQPKL